MALPVLIDKSSPLSFQDQICEQIQALIMQGVLSPGTRIPTSRELAREAGISRNTVTLAYERLIGDGFLQTRPASGTFVSEIQPEHVSGTAAAVAAKQLRPAIVKPPIQFRGQVALHPRIRPDFDFRLSAADPALFPTREWRRHILSALDRHGGRISNAQPPAGDTKLRHAIARWLGASRGITVTADEVLVVSGAQQAYTIISHLLVSSGVGVVVEAPCHMGAAGAFQACGANLMPVPVDESGLCPDQLPDGAALAYLTPSHQSPVGGVLPLERRERVLAWARKNGTYVFEDDIGCEFHYDSWQPPALKSLDRDELVIYCGSFSQTLGAGLRLGYLVLPPELAVSAVAAKALLDGGCPWLEQAALANLMESGSFARHVANMKRILLERRNLLIDNLRDNFNDARLLGLGAGTHLGLELGEGMPSSETIQQSGIEHGIAIHVPARCSFDEAANHRFQQNTLYLGYRALPVDSIPSAIARLASVVAALGPVPVKSA